MVITELYIKNFGKFSERKFYLRDGIQVISGENEWGKSTLHAFIRAMLFGMERGRGKAAAKDHFTRYEPWDGTGYYGGIMRFSCGGRNFRLERRFSRAGKYVSLVCEDDGEELSVEHGDLEMLLDGMTPAVFDNTVSIGQFMAEPGQELARSLKNYTANYYETGGAEIDLNGAVQTLRSKRKEAEKTLAKEKEKLEQKRRDLFLECRYLETDMEQLRAQYDNLDERLRKCAEAQEREEVSPGADGQTGSRDGNRVQGMIGTGAAGIFAGTVGTAWSFLSGGGQWSGPGVPLRVISLVFLLLGIVLFCKGVAGIIKKKADEKKFIKVKKENGNIQKNVKSFEIEADKIQWEMGRIRSEWKEKEIRCGNLREQAEEAVSGEGIRQIERRSQALETAEQELIETARNLGGELARRLNARASEIFSAVTDGKYTGLKVSEELNITVWDGERRIPAERLSRGTLEQIYFSVRMAAAELLQEESLPVILDETFAFYDDKRLESALKWLSAQERQVIILSCQKREEKLLRTF